MSERGKGLYNKDDAAVMLLAVYQRDGRPQGSAPLLEKLSAKHPRNYLVLKKPFRGKD